MVQAGMHRWRAPRNVCWKRLTTLFKDGVECHIDCWVPNHLKNKCELKCVWFVCHGLGGNSDSSYCRWLVHEIKACNEPMAVVVYNRRGHVAMAHGDRIASHYDPDDMDIAIQFVQKLFRDVPIYGIGFSMGGNLLLKWMGERRDGGAGVFRGMVVVSGCLHLVHGFMALRPGSLVDKLSIWFLKDVVKGHISLTNNAVERALLKCTTFWEADAMASKKSDLYDYYESCSAVYVIDKINVPVLSIISEDDPFVKETIAHYEFAHMANKKHWCTVVTDRGGHIGWMEGGGCGKPWVYRLPLDFCNILSRL